MQANKKDNDEDDDNYNDKNATKKFSFTFACEFRQERIWMVF